MPGYIEPTPTQRQVLAFITEQIRNRGRAPTNQEISDHFGWKSTNAARGHVRLLIRKGLLVKEDGLARGVGLPDSGPAPANWREVPVLGRVAAGQPIEAVQDWETTIGVDAGLFPEPDIFGLRVKGTSMIGAGIREGDIALVRQADEASDGDVVVALVDGEATVKRYYRRRDAVVLHAENPEFADLEIRPGVNFALSGVVVGLVRRLAQ